MPRGRLSPHFTASEFECRDRCGYGQPHGLLIDRLERLRTLLDGRPLVIVSGLRCPPRNSLVRGATRSRHQSGEAVDLVQGVVTVEAARHAGFTGIGTKGRWATHVDVRTGSSVTQWAY